MFRTSRWQHVIRIEMARSLAGRPLHTVSAYALGDTLVDSGCPVGAGRLAAWAAGHGIRRVVHTHHHEDHCGGDAVLRERLGIEILAGPRTVPILAHFYRLPLYRRLVWGGRPGDVQATTMGDEVEIDGATFEVIPTPGHCHDHVCLYDRKRGWLFSGDLYIHPQVRYLRPVEDAWQMVRSLERLQQLEPRVLLCSHAGVVEDATTALATRIASWRELAQQVSQRVAAGRSTALISRELLGREGLMAFLSLGDFSKRNLVRALAEPEPTPGAACRA